MERFDLIVIGSGSGLEVSAAAADAGWRVAVVEEGPFGGTCRARCVRQPGRVRCGRASRERPSV